MNKNDLSKYFTTHKLSRLPLYKAMIALFCCALLTVSAGAGIAVMAAGIPGDPAAMSVNDEPEVRELTATPEPTEEPTPEPSPTPAPIQLAVDATAIQQSVGVTVKDNEKGTPVLNEEFDVTLTYKAPKDSKNTKDSKDKTPAQKEVSTYKTDPKTGTLLVEKLAVGDYTVSIGEKEGYVVPKPVTVTVKEKVVYKADTEAVKDKIKNESQVGAGDIVSDNKVIQDETSPDFDPTVVNPPVETPAPTEAPTPTPSLNDYDFNGSTKEEIKGTAYLVQNNTQNVNGRSYLLKADGSVSAYYVSETAQTVDGQTYIVKAALDQAMLASAASETAQASSVLARVAAAVFRPFRLDNLLFTRVSAEEETAVLPGESADTSTEQPTEDPTAEPTEDPTAEPTEIPTEEPTQAPTAEPTAVPTEQPTEAPTAAPTQQPLPAELVLYNADQKAAVPMENLGVSGLKALSASEILLDVRYSGWYPSEADKQAYYDPDTHKKVTGEQTIAGTLYYFDENGKAGPLPTPTPAPTPAPTQEPQHNGLVKGVDVSKYQGNIDWNAVKNSGIDFAIIRVGYRGYGTGALVEDSMFRQNIQGATAAGLKVGLYFYSQAINEEEAVEEASMVLRLCRGYGIQYPIYFDTEKVANATGRADSISREQRTANAVAFCETIRNAGYRPGVYSYASWFYNQLNMANLSKYSIWIAQYREQLSFRYGYDIWQYTSSGRVPGIPKETDMNVSKLG